MFTLRKGELTIRKGRLTTDMTVEAGASLRNDGEVFTHALISHVEIKGRGTLWTHVSSKPVGGTVDPLQIIIYSFRAETCFRFRNKKEAEN